MRASTKDFIWVMVTTVAATIAGILLGVVAAQAVDNWGPGILQSQGGSEVNSGCLSGNQVGTSGAICFDIVAATSTTFSVTSGSALACLKTDVDQEGVSATGTTPVTAVIRFAPYGDTSTQGRSGIQACASAGCTLTGANNVPAGQLACVVLGPGAYRVDFPTLPDSPDVGLFTVTGGGG